MKLARDLLLILIGGFLWNAFLSQSAELDASFGQCKYKHASEWIWWSPQFGFNGNMAPACEEVGASFKLTERTGVRVGLLEGGRFTSNNTALWGDDGQTYVPGQPCDTRKIRNCLAQFKGDGGMYGLTLGLWREFTAGPFTVRPEIGGLFYHSWFDVDATPLNDGTSQVMHWTHWNHASGNHYTPYVGITALLGKISLRAEWFRNVHELMDGDPSNFGVTNGTMRRLSIAYHF